MDDLWPEGTVVAMGPLQVRLVGAVRSTQEEVWGKRRWMQPGTGIAASAQSAGVGRGSKSWVSPQGGVYLSVLVGGGLAAEDADLLGAAASLSALKAARELLPREKLFLKWPNDVVTWGPGRALGKLAGVLVRTEVANNVVERAAVGIGLNVSDIVEGVSLDDAGLRPVSLEGLAKRAGRDWTAPRTKVVEWVAGWLGSTLQRVRSEGDAVRREFSREVAKAPLAAKVAGVREEFRPLGVQRGGALVVRRRSGARATVSFENAERLVWTIGARPSSKRAKPKAKPKAISRAGARRAAPPRSSRARSARPSSRSRRTRK